MDVRAVLQAARAEAGLDQRRLALAAGVARTTVVAYETGTQSPTVRQLTRLLAACGLRAEVVLQPLATDLDRELGDQPPRSLESLQGFAASLTAAGVRWALDGRSAVSVQGLPLPHDELVVALVDDEVTRRWLRTKWVKGWDRHGFSLAPSWYESPEQVRGYVRKPVYSTLGPVQIRFLDEPPASVLQLEVEGEVVPVLPLGEVRRAHSDLAELLDRHEQRLAAVQRRRTV